MDGAAAPGAVRTTCAYCGVGCGILATPDGKGGAAIVGDPAHPANFGRLCSKGAALGETLGLAGRLLSPRIDGREAEWGEALDLVAAKFRAAIEAHGPDSVAFYVSGQLLTEDYYVANKLMKGFIGAANIDSNSRLCMASSVAGHRRAFGTDTVPGCYADLEQADLAVLVGSNLAWCHPVLYQRIAAAKAARPSMKVVVIDPRRTATCEIADMHLAIAPDADTTLFNGLLSAIVQEGAVDAEYVARHVAGFAEALACCDQPDRDATAAACGLEPAALAMFYQLWVRSERVVTLYSQGVNQSDAGTDKVNAILNCHLATGRIGRPGTGPFSVTGQPNAMGGREVGGLANMLACHLDIENQAHRRLVQGFWQAPRICEQPGLKAVDLFDAVAAGRIKALWIMGTNPAVSLPDADRVRTAIHACDFVVVSDIMAQTDTTELAHVLLPAAGWGEKDGTVTNSERRISRQRAFLPLPGQARPDWRIVCDVAARMGWADAFDYESPAEIFREHAALSGLAKRDFDIGALAAMDGGQYESLAPVQWPMTASRAGGRFFADGQFHTPDGRARMVPVRPRPSPGRLTAGFPLLLNTGRVRDHWHTMTRTGLSPRLSQHIAEPFVEVHPSDAVATGLGAAELAVVESARGRMIARVLITDRAARGSVFVPIHWTAQNASLGRADALVAPVTDPVSGQPALKGTAVRIAPFRPAWHGFAVSRAEPLPEAAYWAKARTTAGWRIELAATDVPDDWTAYSRRLFGRPQAEALLYTDAARGRARVALVEEGRVVAALFAGPEPVEVARTFLVSALERDARSASAELLAGRPGPAAPDPGATVCSCFQVGVNTILEAIATRGLSDVAAIGQALQAGTNCGSCRPELATLLMCASERVAAE